MQTKPAPTPEPIFNRTLIELNSWLLNIFGVLIIVVSNSINNLYLRSSELNEKLFGSKEV